jgi:hypothetical protein
VTPSHLAALIGVAGAGELGVTQPVLYTAFASRQALIDAVVLAGFDDLADELEAADSSSLARMRVYLDFAAANPRIYEAMFSLPSGLPFATDDNPPRDTAPPVSCTSATRWEFRSRWRSPRTGSASYRSVPSAKPSSSTTSSSASEGRARNGSRFATNSPPTATWPPEFVASRSTGSSIVERW